MTVAKKRDPKKWSAAKARAKRKMGGKHSARAMQLATKYYKDAGGTYSGKSNQSIIIKGICSDHQSKEKGDCCREAVREAAKKNSEKNSKI